MIEPICLGPTWRREESGDYVLPELTLGYQIIAWVERYLLNDEGDPFVLTNEQRRFILHWYAVDDRGRFNARKGVLQRLKGWGQQARTRWPRC